MKLFKRKLDQEYPDYIFGDSCPPPPLYPYAIKKESPNKLPIKDLTVEELFDQIKNNLIKNFNL